MPAIEALGAQLVAISPQTPDKSAELRAKHRLTFPILFDARNAWSEQLGLTHSLPEDLREVYRGFQLTLPDFNGDDSWSLPIPARMVIRPDGTIQSIDANPDYTRRPEPEATLEVLRTLV